MSSNARDLHKQEPSGDTQELMVNSFVALVAAFKQASELNVYTLEVPADGIASLHLEDIHLVFLDTELWRTKERVIPFLAKASDSSFCFICVGQDQELNSLPTELEVANFRTLPLPVRMPQLSSLVKNFHRLQTLVYKAERTHKNVKETNENVKYVLRVSRELNGVRDTKKLLSLILLKAREITNADAGSIYTVEWNDQRESDSRIVFKVTQNETVFQELEEFVIRINEESMVGCAVVYQQAINIPDLYMLDPNPDKNPYHAKHDKTFDLRTGYQCRSMLTVPMFDISYRVIGVIQLINRRRHDVKTLKGIQDFTKCVASFDDTDVEYAEIVAQQAGIALENAMLTLEKEQLFEGFVNAAVTAIEQRDPTTSGHSHRVAKLTLGLAEIVNSIDSGPFRDVHFDKKQLKEIEYASLLHDFGKLGVREQVLVKAKKLYPWELDLLLERFEHIRSRFEVWSICVNMSLFSVARQLLHLALALRPFVLPLSRESTNSRNSSSSS
jgi:HD-GYP domain-containing protein (c-di-GMP phosphodiesterase class II)